MSVFLLLKIPAPDKYNDTNTSISIHSFCRRVVVVCCVCCVNIEYQDIETEHQPLIAKLVTIR